MSDEPWRMHKLHKWMGNLEDSITDDVWDDIRTHFGVEDITDLGDDHIAEIQEFLDEIDDDAYLMIFQIAIRNIINWWENETYVDVDD